MAIRQFWTISAAVSQNLGRPVVCSVRLAAVRLREAGFYMGVGVGVVFFRVMVVA